MTSFVNFHFRNFPSKDLAGKVWHYDGTAIIQRTTPGYRGEAWVVTGVKAQRQGNCALLDEEKVDDLSVWFRHDKKKVREIEEALAQADKAEGR